MMNNINWKNYKISDLFDVKGSKTTPQLELEKHGKGIYPYVTTQTTNNGQANYYNYYTERGNVITVDSAVIGFSTYQEKNFSASDHVEKLIPKFDMNKNIGLFICIILNKNNSKKFSYGYKASQTRLKKMSIFLPCDNDGKPDFKYMDKYISNIITKQKNIYYDNAKEKLKYLSYDSLIFDNWDSFKIGDIFNVYTGGDLIINKIKKGNIPVISHSSNNNGIAIFSSEINGRKKFDYRKSISLADRGNFIAYVQNKDFYIGTRVKGLEAKDDLPYYSLFYIATSINKQSVKFSYGHNATDNLEDLKIMLPSKNGCPDYLGMDEYIKKVFNSKINKYINN